MKKRMKRKAVAWFVMDMAEVLGEKGQPNFGPFTKKSEAEKFAAVLDARLGDDNDDRAFVFPLHDPKPVIDARAAETRTHPL